MQKRKNEARTKFTGSYKKKACNATKHLGESISFRRIEVLQPFYANSNHICDTPINY